MYEYVYNVCACLCVNAGGYAIEGKHGCWCQPSALFEAGSSVVCHCMCQARLAVSGRSAGFTDACY